jgi:hypothetical protein
MSVEERVRKLEGHAAALLDSYRGLRQSFALLEPLLPTAALSQTLGSGSSREGFAALRQALFLGCALDVWKLCLDADCRTPSITRLVEDLGGAPEVVAALRCRAAHFRLPRQPGDEPDEASLRQFEQGEQDQRAAAFDGQLDGLRKDWAALRAGALLSPFAVLRDKYIAHLELRFTNGAYAPIELRDVGLQWSDLGRAIVAMEPLVRGLGSVVRSSVFDMAGAVAHFEKVRDDFWTRAR